MEIEGVKKSVDRTIKDMKSTLKTFPCKVINLEGKKEIFSIYRDYLNTSNELYTNLFAMMGNDFKDRDGNVVIRCEEKLQLWCNQFGVENIEEFKTHIFGFYNEFILKSKPKGDSNYIFPAKERGDKELSEHVSYLRGIGFFPFRFGGVVYDVTDGQAGYKYSTVCSVHSRLKSFNECNSSTHKEYLLLKSELEGLRERNIKNHGESDFDSALEFFAKAEKFNFNVGRTSRKFCTFFQNCLKASLLLGSPSNSGYWKNFKGRKITYSCHEEVINLLYTNYSHLWNKENCILEDNLFYDFLEVREVLSRKREYSSFKSIGFNSPLRMKMGNNYVKFNLTHDDQEKLLNFEIRYPKSKLGDNKKDKLNLVCTYKSRKNKVSYLEDLKISEAVSTEGKLAGKPNGNYVLEYKINGKRERKAILNEPSIRIVFRNSNVDLKNLSPKDFDVYIDLSLNVEVVPCHGFPEKELNSIRTSFRKGFGAEGESPKGILRVMGIDLGVKNPFAFSVMEYRENDTPVKIVEGVMPSDTRNQKYWLFRKACYSIRNIIRETKIYVESHKTIPISEENFDYLNNYFSNAIEDFVPFSLSEYCEWLSQMESVPLGEFKNRKNRWVIRVWTCYLRKIRATFNVIRRTGSIGGESSGCASHTEWIQALQSYMSMMNSFWFLGIPYKEGNYNKNTFNITKTQIRNLKLDYIKKLCFEVVELAKKYNVAVIVTERLENIRGNVYNERKDNKLYNLWPVGQIKYFLENASANYGILLDEVDEKHSSQTHPLTHTWGYRDGDEFYWEDENGELHMDHADVIAANNHAHQWLSKHTNQKSIDLVPVNDIYYVPFFAVKSNKSDKNISSTPVENPVSETISKIENKPKHIRVKGFFQKHFNSNAPVFKSENGMLVPCKKSMDELIKQETIKPGKPMRFYTNDPNFKVWISREDRDKKIENIKSKVVNSKFASGKMK